MGTNRPSGARKPAVKYSRFKKDVKLKAGQMLAYTPGKGYYAKAKPKPAAKKAPAKKTAVANRKPVAKKTVKRAPAKKKAAVKRKPAAQKPAAMGPTSLAPNPLHGKKRPVARVLAKVRVKVVKARHAVAPTKAAKRAQVVAFLKWGIAHAAAIHYAQIRPIPQVKPGKLPALPFTTDCSGFVTMAYQYAGLPDPNGLHYDGQGYTGTLIAHGHHRSTLINNGQSVDPPKPGDIGIYGSAPGHHAVAALNLHGTELASHGSEVGPLDISAAIEGAYQKSPLTWLNLEALV